MRVLQLIDSLRSGGAEQMAVSYANGLEGHIEASYLCCTRREGKLKYKINPEVGYLFLNKNSTLDMEALRDLCKFIKMNGINLLHAHGTSWFLAVLVKIRIPRLKLVWHDHYGRNLSERKIWLLKLFSSYFDGVIAVNYELKEWSVTKLRVKNVCYIQNFISKQALPTTPKLELLGNDKDFKIICVANFRPQKDHLNLLRAFERVLETEQEVNLHLVGKLDQDEYSVKVKDYIAGKNLQDRVFLYGEQENVQELLLQADLGVLSSASEGLPVALLEYGNAGLPVVTTQVGEISEVIGGNGLLVPPGNSRKMAIAFLHYFNDPAKRKRDSDRFQKKIRSQYSEENTIPKVLAFYNSVLSLDAVNQ